MALSTISPLDMMTAVENLTLDVKVIDFSPLSFGDQVYLSCFYAFLAIVALTGLVGNSLVIAAILGHRSLRLPTHGFILSLAFSDLTLGVLQFTYQISLTPLSGVQAVLGHWNTCRFLLFVVSGQMRVSSYSLVGETILRFVAVRWPIFFRQKLQWSIVCTCSACIWLLGHSMSILALPHKPANYKLCVFSLVAGVDQTSALCISGFVVPVTIMATIYFAIGVMLNKRRRQVAAMLEATRTNLESVSHTVQSQGTQAASSADVKAKKRELKLVMMVAVLLGYFTLAWLPNSMATFTALLCRSCSIPRDIWVIFKWLLYTNSAVNVFIYAGQNTEFRRAFKKDLKRLYTCVRQS